MTSLWKKKLAAWLHDPAEKAFVLMRDYDNQGIRLGHESGSVADLREALGISKTEFDKRADHFASAADRPQWPFEEGKPRPDWANVRFHENPVLIHPLESVGKQDIRLGKLGDVSAPQLRHASLAHFKELIERDADGQPDYRLTLLAFWRFGPEHALVAPEIGELWRLMPADTRVPDHSIWSHLDVVSAMAGALGGEDGKPALLTVSLGPVQGFISQARSTSDLWAGSHLLSSLAWEGLKVICARLGPDAVLFPHLRGLAMIDLWLLEQAGPERAEAWRHRFASVQAPWMGAATDANPLFAATLPNKFMALVPADHAAEIAREVEVAVRSAALEWAMEAARRVFEEAGADTSESAHWRQQVTEQLAGFPEVHAAVAEWPVDVDPQGWPVHDALQDALRPFYPEKDAAVGFFATPGWRTLAGRALGQDGLQVAGSETFFKPNPGLLYPAVHELAERSLAAAKSLREFRQLPQCGYRCTVTGEHEALTHDPQLLDLPRGSDAGSVWRSLEGRFGIKQRERLGALATLKRLWPNLFSERVRAALELEDGERLRYVVSTHAMALATSAGLALENDDFAAKLAELAGEMDLGSFERVALPRSLHRRALRVGPAVADTLARLPSVLDQAREDASSEAAKQIGRLLGARPETYYALIQMDGDHMGAWMAGDEAHYQRPFAASWHPQVREAVRARFGGNPGMRAYMDAARPMSPARHAAISRVLNDFSTHVARHVIEDVFKGKLLYAGGDDVLAMVSVDDLLPAIALLRAAYSGLDTGESVFGLPDEAMRRMRLGNGFALLDGRLMPMMGSAATASVGAVVAHHQAPLAAVLRELRAAEARAKAHGRNAFSIRLMKRAGGATHATCRFWHGAADPAAPSAALPALLGFARELARPTVSRRAVYNSLQWLAALPTRTEADDADWRQMTISSLAYQFYRQGIEGEPATTHAQRLVDIACENSENPGATADTLQQLLVVSEFFARESRMEETQR